MDVVISRADLPKPIIEVRPSGEFSDHSLILFQKPLPRPPLQLVSINTRAWKNFDAERFRGDLLESRLCDPAESFEGLLTDELQDTYDTTLRNLLDKNAPSPTARRRV